MPVEFDKSKGKAGFWQVYFTGISMVMAGHCAYWAQGFIGGFWPYFMSIMIVSLAFFCLCLCQAEMISILPFGGGAYGFARVTVGPFLGFMVGFFDSISNIIYVSLFINQMVILVNFCFLVDYELNDVPWMWFVAYVLLILMHIGLGKYSFLFMSVMGVIVIAIPIVYMLGTTDIQNFHENVVVPSRHVDLFPYGNKGFVALIPFSELLYFGVDMLALVCEDTKDAARTVPRALMAVMGTLFVLAVAMIFAVPSQFPGISFIFAVKVPMMYGFAHLFKTSYERATITVLPSILMTLYALTYAFGRQMCALSRSSLLPPVFSWTTSANVPYMSIIFGSLLGFMYLLALQYADQTQAETRLSISFYVAQLCSITVYVIALISFVVFRYKYTTLQRHFHVGLAGIPIAVTGILLFTMMWIIIAFLQTEFPLYDDSYFIVKTFCVLLGIGAIYYWTYARYRQSFSQEEQSIMFAVYVIKANSRHRTVYKWLERKWNRYVGSGKSTSTSNNRIAASQLKYQLTGSPVGGEVQVSRDADSSSNGMDLSAMAEVSRKSASGLLSKESGSTRVGKLETQQEAPAPEPELEPEPVAATQPPSARIEIKLPLRSNKVVLPALLSEELDEPVDAQLRQKAVPDGEHVGLMLGEDSLKGEVS